MVWPKPHFPALLRVVTPRIFLGDPPRIAARLFRSPVCLPFCVPPSVKTSTERCRNINLPSIAYAFRPGLRDRLTLSGLTFLRKP